LKEINKQIIKQSKIEEFSNVYILKHKTGQMQYLDYVEDQNGLPPVWDTTFKNYYFESKLSKLVKFFKKFKLKNKYQVKASKEFSKKPYRSLALKIFSKNILAQPHQMAAAITQAEISQLKKDFEIDVMALLKSQMIQETSVAIQKEFMKKFNELASVHYEKSFDKWDKFLRWVYKIFKKTYIKKIQVKNIKHLLTRILREANMIAQTGRRGVGNFVICSLKTGTLLQDSSQYIFAPSQNEPMFGGSIYPIGKIANITIYIDPYMKYDDNTIFIGRKTQIDEPGIKLFFNENGSSLITTVVGVGAPKIILRTEHLIEGVGFYPENEYRKFIYNDKHIKL
ncbi:MAG: hypothetical protein WC554_09625, partial [Clostridia bacterium]